MGEERPAFKAEAEQKHSARDRLRNGAAQIGAFFRGLRWPSDWRRQMRWPAIVLGTFAGAVVLGCVALFLVMAAVAPRIPDTDLYALNRPQALTFTDENGATVGVRGAIVGERLKLSEMPAYLPAAFLAMEDRKFYHHWGIDPNGLMRAAMVDFKAHHIVQGGSTITQQVVKIVLLSPDRTFSRKLQELAGAFELEHKLTKDQILEIYLNRLYLGSGAYGVDGAAHVYFGKSARDVTLSEAAMLAALTRAPSAFSPRRDLESAQGRANQVLTAMVSSGAINKDQAYHARANAATVIDPTQNLARDYYLDAAADEVKQLLPSATGDLTITTAMDPALQEAARAQVGTVLNKRGTENAHATQAALVSMTTDGAVRALIGGKDYAESSFNRVTKAHRQPGSAFKPFVYLAALEHGLTPATVRVDEPITIKNWAPDNYSESHVGPVTLQQAFAQSINTVAVQLGQEIGLPQIVSVAQSLGIQSPLQPVASLPLGTSEVTPLELTAAYASFPSLGYRVRPYLVTDVRSPSGTVLYHRNPAPPARVFAEDQGMAMNSMMYQVVQAGTGRAAAVPGHDVAGKTGTSADYRDAWFVGFSPELVTGVWVGNDDFSAMKKITGGTLPAQIWSGYMRVALKNAPASHLPRSEPVPPAAVAEGDGTHGDGENVIQKGLDGIGSFFDRLFGGGGSTPARSSHDRSSSADDGRYYPEESGAHYAMDADDLPNQMPVAPLAQPDQVPVDRPRMSVPAIAPPPPRPEQRAAREDGETYVFQNGETGERQIFRGRQAPDREDRYAYGYRDRSYDPPRVAPPPPPRGYDAPDYASPPPSRFYEEPRARERDGRDAPDSGYPDR